MLVFTNVLYMVSSIYNQIKFQAQTTLDSVVNFIQIWRLLRVIYKCKNGLNTLQGVYKYSNLFLERQQSGFRGLFHLERGGGGHRAFVRNFRITPVVQKMIRGTPGCPKTASEGHF